MQSTEEIQHTVITHTYVQFLPVYIFKKHIFKKIVAILYLLKGCKDSTEISTCSLAKDTMAIILPYKRYQINGSFWFCFVFYLFIFGLFAISRAAPAAYGGSRLGV